MLAGDDGVIRSRNYFHTKRISVMNILSWGLDFLYQQAAQHIEIDMEIGIPDGTKFPIRASRIETKAMMDASRLKIVDQHHYFMIDRVEFEKTGLPLVRGLELSTTSTPCVTYVVKLEPKGSFSYNDPERRKIILVTSEKLCSPT